MKPYSPEEAKQAALSSIPDEVISIVNKLLAENLRSNDTATILQKEIIAAYEVNHSKGSFNVKWLDFEDLYRNNGWKCNYDGPAYCETYDAVFKFEKKTCKN